MIEAFYAEDAPVLARESLAAVAPESWPNLRFQVVPSLKLLTGAWPVHAARERFDREDAEAVWDEAPPLTAEPAHLRVWRVDERVRYRAMAPHELEALGAARAGETFGAICDRLVSAVGEPEAARQASSLVSSWVSDGLLARLI